MQATKKPHNYHKTVGWQKDDRIRKSPLKFYGYYYSKISEDCQASIFTKLRWLSVVFLCCFMAHDSRKLRKAFCLQYTGIFVQKLYRMAYLFSGCLRVDRADPQNGPAFQLGGQHAGKAFLHHALRNRCVEFVLLLWRKPLRRIAKIHNGQLRRCYYLPLRLVPKHGLRPLCQVDAVGHHIADLICPPTSVG